MLKMIRSVIFIIVAVVLFGKTSAFAPQNLRPSSNISPSRPAQSIRTATPNTALFAKIDRNNVVMMPATLERPKVKVGSGPAVLDRPVVEKKRSKEPVKERKVTGSEAWEVRIYNDVKNTREFVARCLVQIVGQTEIAAYQTMMQAHERGIAVVGRYAYEVAEMYYGQLKKNGIVCDLVPVEEEK